MIHCFDMVHGWERLDINGSLKNVFFIDMLLINVKEVSLICVGDECFLEWENGGEVFFVGWNLFCEKIHWTRRLGDKL